MDRNTILAIVFSFVLIVVVFYITPSESEKPTDKAQTEKTQIKKEPSKNKKVTKENKNANKIKVSASSLKITPTDEFNPAKETGKKKIKTFIVKTDIFKINFTTIDAAVKNLNLVEVKENYKKDKEGKKAKKKYKYGYKDNSEKFHLIDVVYEKSKKKVFPLATSFVGANKLEQKVRSAYQYSVLDYDGVKLKTSNYGTLGEKIQQYLQKIKKNIRKIQKLYNLKDLKNKKLKIVLFVSEYNILSGSKSKKIELVKIYTFAKNDYLFDLDIIVTNLSKGDVLINGNDNDNQNTGFYFHWGRHVGPDIKKEGRYNEFKLAYLELQKGKKYRNNKNDISVEEHDIDESMSIIPGLNNKMLGFKWVEMDSQFITVCLIPEWKNDERGFKIWNKNNYIGEFYAGEEIAGKKEEIIGVGVKPFSLQPKESKKFHFSVFVAPKTRSILNQKHYKDFQFVKVRDRSIIPLMPLIEWGIESLLFLCNRLVNNFGLAIIFVTIILKIILHPLTKKSLDSTRKMQQLAPKIKEIDAKFKGKDKQEKQKATMAMYKKEGVNPLGGCLPLILQFPVFIALYNVLPALLELKNADFLWINDLSSPDTILNLKQYINYDLDLNILPIIMSLSSILQMKISPTTAPTSGQSESMQKMMSYMMPGVFLFIFWTMPSGLVLYWTIQNFFTVAEQLLRNYTTKRKNKSKDENKLAVEKKPVENKKTSDEKKTITKSKPNDEKKSKVKNKSVIKKKSKKIKGGK